MRIEHRPCSTPPFSEEPSISNGLFPGSAGIRPTPEQARRSRSQGYPPNREHLLSGSDGARFGGLSKRSADAINQLLLLGRRKARFRVQPQIVLQRHFTLLDRLDHFSRSLLPSATLATFPAMLLRFLLLTTVCIGGRWLQSQSGQQVGVVVDGLPTTG